MSHYEINYADACLRKNVIAYREHLGMAQTEFVRHLDHVISRGTLSHVEAGLRVINNLRFVETLARKSGHSIEALRTTKINWEESATASCPT